MLVACRLAGLSTLETYYAGVNVRAQSGLGSDAGAAPRGIGGWLTRCHRTPAPGEGGRRAASPETLPLPTDAAGAAGRSWRFPRRRGRPDAAPWPP
jgi:hypothetical protein